MERVISTIRGHYGIISQHSYLEHDIRAVQIMYDFQE